jgi:hypothetical protein
MLISFRNHCTPIHLLASNNAFAGSVVLVNKWNAPHRSLEFFQASVTRRIVLNMRENKFTPTLLSRDIA